MWCICYLIDKFFIHFNRCFTGRLFDTIHGMGAMTSAAFTMKLSTLYLLYCVTVPTFCSLTTTETSSINIENCRETAPNCSYTIYNSGRMPGTGNTSDYYHEDKSVVSYFIDTSFPVCAFDPFIVVPDLRDVITLAIYISCQIPGTRLVIVPRDDNYTIPQSVVVDLVITNCTTYWKDISTIGHYSNLKNLFLNYWNDEFACSKPIFFETRVQLENPGKNKGNGSSILPIKTMANVSYITVINKAVRPISTAFTHHLGPVSI